MREERASWELGTVLICTNERGSGAPRPSCGRRAGLELKTWLKAKARAEGGPAAQMRVLTTSCLDTCPADGVAVALMPGDRVLVVDPVTDKPALLEALKTHAEELVSSRLRSVPSKVARSLVSRVRRG